MSQRMLIESQKEEQGGEASRISENVVQTSSTNLLQDGTSMMNVRGLRCPDEPLPAQEVLAMQHGSAHGPPLYTDYVNKEVVAVNAPQDPEAGETVSTSTDEASPKTGVEPAKQRARGLINDFLA